MNRTEKSDRDAGEWTPARHGAWFAERVIAVKLEYGLSVDARERDALEALLAGGGAQLSCVDADTTSPTVAISSAAGAPVTGPFSITVAFSKPVTGFELDDLVVGNGSATELQGSNASYTATITPVASGAVTVDIAAGAAQDGAGNPSAAAVQFSIVADLTPVPALPVIVATVGLGLDIVGVCILYRYGFGGTDWTRSDIGYLSWGGPSAAERERRARLGRVMAPAGLACLVVGFVLQAVAQWL